MDEKLSERIAAYGKYELIGGPLAYHWAEEVAALEAELAGLRAKIEGLRQERTAFYEALVQEDTHVVQRVTEGILLRRKQALAAASENTPAPGGEEE